MKNVILFFLVALLSMVEGASASASSYVTLYQFTDKADGGEPSGVIQDAAGTVYGQTAAGGTLPCTTQHGSHLVGCGTVYSLSKVGGFKVLASFHGPNGAYGASGLTLFNSVLIGATSAGGASDDGVIYAVKTDGSRFTLVHQFSGADGVQPIGPLVVGKNGVFYGITLVGGPGNPSKNTGVLFSLTTAGTFKVLHSFSVASGENPTTLLATPSGTLVGSTFYGGPTNPNYCPSGCGVVFSFDPQRLKYTVFKTFDGEVETSPYLGSVGADGTVYGNNNNLFSISPSGVYQVLGQTLPLIGSFPTSGPALAPDGSLYGTYTQNIGANNGTLYSYSAGAFGLAYTFGDDGIKPQAEPTVTPAGFVLGTTTFGGSCGNCGTVYQYTP